MVSPSSPSYVYMSRRQRVAFEDTTSTPLFLRKEFGPQHHYSKDNNKPREVTEKTKEVFYEELKPLWIVQMVFGMFPFERPLPGHTNLKFFSAIVLYCFAWYAMLGYMDVFIALRTFGNISNSGLRFNEVILPCNILLYLIPPLINVPTHLWDGNKMADYFNLWWKFQSVLHTISEKQVATYRDLWLQLSKLSNYSGNANQGTVGQILVFIFVTTLLSLYGVLSGLLSYKYGLTEIVLTINSVMGLITTTLTCDFAHKAYEQIGTNFVGQLSEDMSVNKAIEKEMRLFLAVAVANPPEISLGGFAVINRNMTVSMMSMMVTYLVVLAQFGFQDEK
ncbi:unnamed protein product [Timema podura]|uniref:Gustatory receptor n=1 Tax=Timema podura TaxID=61482 RepID=A0ABN7NS97_TIMPD|nr:unnamed protein product [Timema podura]